MADVLTSSQRSYCMSRVRGVDTSPEMKLRKAFWHLGLRYRVKNRLPGRPDLVFRSFNTVVFVDGCFWHSCPKHSVAPKTNREFWQVKLQGNIERDRRVNQWLLGLGWRVIRVWEHEVRTDPERTAERLLKEMRGRRRGESIVSILTC